MLVALCCRVWHISGAMCLLTFNFASARIKCVLAFTRKYLPQFRVSILLTNYEGRSSLKTQLKIEFLLMYTASTKVFENIPGVGILTGKFFLMARGWDFDRLGLCSKMKT